MRCRETEREEEGWRIGREQERQRARDKKERERNIERDTHTKH